MPAATDNGSLPSSAVELAKWIRQRRVSSVEVVRHCLDTVDRRNDELQAFVAVRRERSLRAAACADAQIARRDSLLPPFLGVPTAIKDHDHLRGSFTRLGSRAFQWLWSPVDGKTAFACRKAGFVLMGKLATSEFTILPFVHTRTHPPTRNPIDPSRYSGGSSGGSSAAVASGMLPIATAADGAGSIRVPAAYCGLVGFKPSRYVLPFAYGLFDPLRLSTDGPIARTVRDAAALLDVLALHPWLGDSPYPGSYLAACSEAPGSLRIRMCTASPLVKVDDEIEAAVRRAAKALSDLGHTIEEIAPLDMALDEFLPVMQRMVANIPFLPGQIRCVEPTTRWLHDSGRAITKEDARERKLALEKRVLEWFGDADAMLTPTVPTLPPAVGAFEHLDGEGVFRAIAPIGAFTAAFNVSGQPGVSLPMGRSRTGLPLAIQLVGREKQDHALFKLAAQLEAASESATPPPSTSRRASA